jgi:hypothetical protein
LSAASEPADRLHGRLVQAIDIEESAADVPCFIMPPGPKIAIK